MGEITRSGTPRRRYPTRADVNRFIDVARANGIAVGSLAVSPDGTMRVSTGADADTQVKTVFDTWDQAGRL